MSNYGDLVCLWLDSYLSPFDWRAVNPATGKPYGDEIVAMARAKQPKMVIWGGTQPDLTSCSHPEDGIASYPLWNVMRQGQMHPGFGPPSTEGWIIPEAYNCHGTFAWVPSTPRQLMERVLCVGRTRSQFPASAGARQTRPDRRRPGEGRGGIRRRGSPSLRKARWPGPTAAGVGSNREFCNSISAARRRSPTSFSKRRLPRASTFSSTAWTCSPAERGRPWPRGNRSVGNASSGSSRPSPPRGSAFALSRPTRSRTSSP